MKTVTLFSSAASWTGSISCFPCFLEVWQTRQTGIWSSKQKSLSFSLCRLQSTSDPALALWLLSFKNVSQVFLRDRLQGGLLLEDLLLQSGHSWDPFWSQYCCRQTLQKLWLQLRTTGSLKISVHTVQERSSSRREDPDAILSPSVLSSVMASAKSVV